MQTLTDIYGPPISVYTRRQAIEDGILVDLMHTTDEWPANMVREAGIRVPVAITATVFHDCVAPIDDEDGTPGRGEVLAPCQDEAIAKAEGATP